MPELEDDRAALEQIATLETLAADQGRSLVILVEDLPAPFLVNLYGKLQQLTARGREEPPGG